MANKRKIHNCEFCGRDTVNKSKICGHCMKGVGKHKKPSEKFTEDEIAMFRESHGISRDNSIDTDVRNTILDLTE